MTSLLDVNVLISLLDANHAHHAAASAWRIQNQDSWASCALTQNGYIQLATQEKYGNAISVKEAIRRLTNAVAEPDHVFLAEHISVLDVNHVAHDHIQGRGQITDIYLLALSVFHGAQLVTLDKRIPLIAVPNATESHLHVISV